MPDPARNNILIFTLAPPFPVMSGASVYLSNTLSSLADKHNLYLYTIGGDAEKEQIRAHRAEYARYFKRIHVEPRAPLFGERGTVAQIGHLIESARHGLPFVDLTYYSRSAIRNARRMVKEHGIQAMEIHTTHLAFFKKFIPDVPAVLVSENTESDLFPSWNSRDLSGPKKLVLGLMGGLSRRNARRVEVENHWAFEAMTFISRKDMARVAANVDKYYVPLCLPVRETNYEQRSEPPVRLLWLGGFWWGPNREGVLWFVKEILPLFRDRLACHAIRLDFLGANPPEELRELHDGRTIFVHGFVESLDDMLQDTHLLFVPLLSGSGVRVKILEAMSHGIPVLSTSKGCEGLGATDGVDIAVRDSADGFADALLQLAGDPAERSRLSVGARKLLQEDYDLEHTLAVREEMYEKLLRAGRSRLDQS